MKKFLTVNQKKFLLWVVIIFQVLVFFNFFLASKYLYHQRQFAYGSLYQGPKWLWSRANFDGIHYLDIAQKGYGIYQQAFFPFYPQLVRVLGNIFAGQYLLAGWLF